MVLTRIKSNHIVSICLIKNSGEHSKRSSHFWTALWHGDPHRIVTILFNLEYSEGNHWRNCVIVWCAHACWHQWHHVICHHLYGWSGMSGCWNLANRVAVCHYPGKYSSSWQEVVNSRVCSGDIMWLCLKVIAADTVFVPSLAISKITLHVPRISNLAKWCSREATATIYSLVLVCFRGFHPKLASWVIMPCSGQSHWL